MLLVAQIGGEIAAKGAALRAPDIPLPDAVGNLCLQVKAAAVGIKIIVQRIVQLIFVHAQQLIAGLQAQCLGFTARVDAVDLDRHCISPPDKERRGRHCAIPFST